MCERDPIHCYFHRGNMADEEIEGGAGAGLSHTFPAACLYFLD